VDSPYLEGFPKARALIQQHYIFRVFFWKRHFFLPSLTWEPFGRFFGLFKPVVDYVAG
jgi:hypothetical protein